MLRKIFKYDMKCWAKSLVPVYLVLLFLSILTKFSNMIAAAFKPFSFVAGFLLIIFVVGLVGIFFYTFFISILQFYRGIMKEEGYLLHTLPIKKGTLVLSKTVVSTLYMIFTILVALIAFLISINDISIVTEMYNSIKNAMVAMGYSAPLLITIFIILILLGTTSSLLFFYAALSVGQTRSDKKILYSLVYGIIIYTFMQLVSGLSVSLLMVAKPELLTMQNMDIPPQEYLLPLLALSFGLSLFYIVVCYVLSVKFLDKKLNLE